MKYWITKRIKITYSYYSYKQNTGYQIKNKWIFYIWGGNPLQIRERLHDYMKKTQTTLQNQNQKTMKVRNLNVDELLLHLKTPKDFRL